MRRPDALYPAVTFGLVFNKAACYHSLSLFADLSNGLLLTDSAMAQYGLSDDDVVISGISMVFPGFGNFGEMTSKMSTSFEAGPPEKIPVPPGFIGELPLLARCDKSKCTMDNTFFGITKGVAHAISYCSRKSFERTFEALLDAGFNPVDCQKMVTNISANVFISDGEIENVHWDNEHEKTAITGRNRAMEANRVSFHFDAHGNSAARDCGFLGGLSSMEIAVSELRANRADICVVFGGNTIVESKTQQQYHHMGLLSNDGKTRAFDNDASGYVRAEGTAAFVLQRAGNANRIYAKINHLSVKSLRSEGSYLKSNETDWESFLRGFYSESGISPDKIAYLEAYGSGIKNLDAEELNAVAKVFGENRENPLYIGSIKSNVGHTESAADFLSILKAIACFETGLIPANQDYSSPNRKVPRLINGQLKVVDKVTPLPENALIAVSGWSIGNMYGHIVLEGFKKVKEPVVLPIPRLVPLAARTSDFLENTISTLESMPYDPDFYALLSDAFKRKLYKYLGRGYVILPKQEESNSAAENTDELTQRPIWFACSGMGSQWNGMGKGLMDLPIARESLERSHQILEPLGVDLMNVILGNDPTLFDNVLNCFVGIAAIQIALIDVLVALKIKPDGLIGHSVGEVACAYADGALTAEQTLLSSYYRGKCSLEATLIHGAMAAIGKGYNEMKDMLPDQVEIACRNSNTSCTISGPAEIVKTFVEKLTADGVFARMVNSANIAYHSQHIRPAGPILLDYLSKAIPSPKPRSNKWISTSVPEENWNSDDAIYCSATYMTNNLLSPVLFEEGCKHIPENAILIEIAPHGLLQAILKRSMGKNVINIPLTSRSATNQLEFLLQAIGKIHVSGGEIEVNALYPKVEYPLPRGTPSIQPLIHWVQNGGPRWIPDDSKLTIKIREYLFANDSTRRGFGVGGKYLYPTSLYLMGLRWMACQYHIVDEKPEACTVLSNFRFRDPTALSPQNDADEFIEGFLSLGRGYFELVTTKGDCLCNGTVAWLPEGSDLPEVLTLSPDQEVLWTLDKKEIYTWFQKSGYIFPPDFQSLSEISITENGLIGKVSKKASLSARIEGVLQLFILNAIGSGRKLVYPSLIRNFIIFNNINDQEEDLQVVFNSVMNVAYSSEFYMAGVEFVEIVPDAKSLTVHSVEMISYQNPQLSSEQAFLGFCCNIVEKTMKSNQTAKVLQLAETPSQAGDTEILSHMPSALVTVKPSKESAGIRFGEYDLVICKSQDLNQVAPTASGFILLESDTPITIPPDFGLVSQQVFRKERHYSLLKKKIVLNGESNFIVMPASKEELLAELRYHRGKSSALIVGFKEPAEGFALYQEIIESQVDIKLKWLFLLDENKPEFQVTTHFYHEQLILGLSMNVLFNGNWHHVYPKELEAVVAEVEEATAESAITAGGNMKTRVMGVVTSNGADLDPSLSWPIPASWTDEDAEFVPYAYSMAYYCFCVLSKIMELDTVLVTDAMSAGGQAAVAVALSQQVRRVLASVASTDEALQLKKLFPKLNQSDILFHTDKHMILKLKMTAPESHPNIIYNFLDGHIFQSSYNEVSQWAKIFHFGRDDITQNTTINMATMIRCVSLYAVSRNNIWTWTTADKQIVQKLVLDGLNSGVVKPFVLAKSPMIQADEIPKQLSSISKTPQQATSKLPRNNQFEVSDSGSYVLVGETSDYELDVAEWLARRGAKKIQIYNPLCLICPQYQRGIQSLKLRRNIDLQVIQREELQESIKSGTVNAVFFVDFGREAHDPGLHLFNEISGTTAKHLVAITKKRKMHKIPSIHAAYTNILWNVDNDLISQMLDLFTPFFGEHSAISVNKQWSPSSNKLPGQLLENFIPQSIEGYCNLGSTLKSLPEFVEMSTLGVRSDVVSESSPVFVIPGFEEEPVEFLAPMLQNVFYSVLLAKIPHNGFMSVPSVASALVLLMKKFGETTFNLVGLTTGCSIAVEIARQLENQGMKVNLVLVDNPSDELQKGIQSIDGLRSILLSILASISPKPVDKILRDPLPWKARLNHLVSCMELPKNSDNWLQKAVCYIYDRYLALIDFNINSVKLNGPLTVLRSKGHADEYNYSKLCMYNKTVDVPLDRRDFLQSVNLADFINKTAITRDMVVSDLLWPRFEDLKKWSDFLHLTEATTVRELWKGKKVSKTTTFIEL